MTTSDYSELQRASRLVEGWLTESGFAAARHPDSDDGLLRSWSLRRGSATVIIEVRGDSLDAASASLLVAAPILTLPASGRGAFCEHLLRLNLSTLTTCAFAINDDDQVVVTSDRSTEDLSLAELDEIISYVASFADYYDNILSDQFGAEMLGEE